MCPQCLVLSLTSMKMYWKGGETLRGFSDFSLSTLCQPRTSDLSQLPVCWVSSAESYRRENSLGPLEVLGGCVSHVRPPSTMYHVGSGNRTKPRPRPFLISSIHTSREGSPAMNSPSERGFQNLQPAFLQVLPHGCSRPLALAC